MRNPLKSKAATIGLAVVLAIGAVAFLIGPKPQQRPITDESAVAASGATTIEIEDPVHDRPFTASTWSPSGDDQNVLVVLSHGFSGDRTSHSDLAVALAEQGYTVVAPTHPDLAGLESNDPDLDPLTLRPRHLSLAIDEMSSGRTSEFEDVVVVGHSLGGYSALRLAGAAPSGDGQLDDHCRANPGDDVLCSERARSRFANLTASAADMTDPRVTKIALLAPGYGPLFSDNDLMIDAPVLVVAATADKELPGSQVEDLVRMLPASTESAQVEGGHYVFTRPCTAEEASTVPDICDVPAGIDRQRIQADLVTDQLVPFIN